MAELYVNGKAVDLDKDAEVSMTYQINELGRLDSRNAHFSNTFFAPYTIDNTKIFENAEQPQSSTNLPYQLLDCEVIIDGIDVSNFGKLYISSTGEGYNLNVFAGNKALFDELKQKSIRDLDLSAYDHDWTIEYITGEGKSRTEGHVYALVNYGQFTRPSVNSINPRYWHNSFYVHTLIDKILEESTFTLTELSIADDPFYKSLILPVVDSKLQATRANADNIFQVKYLVNTILDARGITSGSNIPFPSVVQDPLGGWSATQYSYTLNNGFEGIVQCKMNIEPLFTDTNGEFTFALEQNGVPIDQKTITTESSITLTTPPNTFPAGTVFTVTWSSQVAGDYAIISAESALYTEPNSDLVYQGKVNPEEILPDMTQADLLKSVLQIFAAYIDTTKKNVRIATLRDIVKNKNKAPDWSSKVVKKDGQSLWYTSKTTTIGNYARRNYLRYKEDAQVTEGFGDGYFSINDETLDGSRNVLRLPFAASEGIDKFTVEGIAIVRKYGDFDETDQVFVEDGKPKPRILYVLPHPMRSLVDDSTTSINLEDETFVGHFIHRFSSNNLGFNNSVINDWYAPLVQLLDRAQKYDAWMRLSPVDIQNLDFFNPVFLTQASSYFLINKVVDYIEGELTKVELIKL